MAEENKKTGPDLGVRGIDAKDLSSTIKEAAKSQGDYNDEIKDSLRQLNAIAKSYESIKSKLDSLSKETLNIKELEKQRSKALEKQIFEANRLKDLQKKAGDEGNKRAERLFNLEKIIKQQEEKARRGREIGDISAQKAALDTLKIAENQRKKLLENIKPTELALAAQIKSKEIADQQLDTVEEYLDTEKEVAKNLGKTGKLFEFFSKKLGIGKNIYTKMVEEARNGEVKTKGMVIATAALAGTIAMVWKGFKKFVDLADQGLRALTGSGGPVSSFVSPFTNLIKQIPFIGGLLGVMLDAFANLMDLSISTQSETQKFARNLGISFEKSKKLTDEFDEFARISGQAYITIEKLRKSQSELSEALGINKIFSKEILAADSQLAEQAGLDLETRKQLAIVAQTTSTTQTKIFGAIVAQNKALTTSLGVNFRIQDIIKKASSFAGVLGLTFAKYPEKLTKSLMITNALGIDLQKLDGIASGLLDFESSIAKEFEAQLLTGKNINLMKARELALNNDLSGLAVEINKQLGTSEDFLKANRLIQDSWSEATGMTRDEIADMLKQQELFAKAGAKDLLTYKQRIAEMERAGTLQREFLSNLSEEEAKLFLNSTATERIAGFMDKIKQSFANLINNPTFKSFIDNIMTSLSDPNFINNIVNKLADFANLLVQITSYILKGTGYLVHAADYLTLGFVIPNEIPEGLVSIGEKIGDFSIGRLNDNFGAVSVSDNTAKNQTNTSAPQGKSPVDNMSMARPQPINLTVQTTFSATKRDAVAFLDGFPNQDLNTGLITG